MIQPTLDVIQTSRSMVDVFGGYNHNTRISDNEFYDMKNMTSSQYPVLAPRSKRGVHLSPYQPMGMVSKDALCYIDGQNFIINEHSIDLNLSTDPEDCPKQLVSMGAYVIVMPDKKYVNTKDLDDYGDIEAEWESSDTVTYSLAKIDGSKYFEDNQYPMHDEPPEDPKNMDLWIDTSSTPHVLKQYSSTSSVWTAIATTYVRISCAGIGSAFKQYDAVEIKGIKADIEQLKDLEGQTSVLWEVGGDYIVVIGFLDVTTTQTGTIYANEDGEEVDERLTLRRPMPNLDFVVECNNRLWGCRYGTDIKGDIVNEIYASKQGDFKNWHCYMGLSTDSYAASCGTDGQWTGAITHLGYPVFFKEDCLHKVYGNFPANFQIQTTACRGVQKGCGNSLAIVNERLYYKSRTGVCIYDGSLPSEVSYSLGNIRYTGIDDTMTGEWSALRNGAVAGAINNKYYISMKSEVDGEWHLFCYDTAAGMWHREDNTRAKTFCPCRGELYYIDNADKKIKTILGTGTAETEPISWMAETGIIGTDMPDKKYISRLAVRMALGIGSKVAFSVQYDSGGRWETLTSLTGTSLRSFTIPIRPKRCDHFRLKIEGVGEAKIFSITKTIEQGSDI